MNYDLNKLVNNQQLFKPYLNQFKTIIVIGATGCGKSTIVPSWIMKLKPNTKVIMTQPRRLATENIANRICVLNNYKLTEEVGFVMGRRYFDSPTCAIIVATAGSAVTTLMAKPDYYDTIILDEVHEQSASMEQLIEISAKIQKYYGAQVILMSATTNTDELSKRFTGDVGIFNMEEHCQEFKINVKPSTKKRKEPKQEEIVITIDDEDYQPDINVESQCSFSDEEDFVKQEEMKDYKTFSVQKLNQNEFKCLKVGEASNSVINKIITNMAIQVARILDNKVDHIFKDKGDILCFMPGIKEFLLLKKELQRVVPPRFAPQYEIKFIHSRFSEEFKQKAINDKSRKISILISTTICETSITIPELRYVIDSCLCKQMIDNRLKTVLCSTKAIFQRMGRLGRCQEGLYIPCINPEFLEMLPEDYADADIYENMNMFILNCFAQQSNTQLDMKQVLFDKNSIYGSNEVQKRITMLKNDGFITQVNDQTQITPKGYIVSSLKGEFADAIFDYYMSFLQAPSVQALIGGVGKQTALQIFIHEIEALQLGEEFRSMQTAEQYNKSHNSKNNKNNQQEIEQFSDYKTVAYAGLVSKPEHFCAPKPQKGQLPIHFSFNKKYFYELIEQNYSSQQNYNHRYAMARIVAMWRHYFPIPTKDPTVEEEEWCKMRLLSPSALREVELEAIQYYNKLEGTFGNLYHFEPLHQIDSDLLAMKYVCTAEELDNDECSKQYNYKKATYNEHNERWEYLAKKYIPGIYHPFVCRFLDEEKTYEQKRLIQVITCLNIANNNFMGIIYSHLQDDIFQRITKKDYPPYKNAKYGHQSLSQQLSVVCNKNGKNLNSDEQNDLKQTFANFVTDRLKCKVKLNMKLKSKNISCNFISTKHSTAHLIQFICKIASLRGQDVIAIEKLPPVLRDIFYNIRQKKFMKKFDQSMKYPPIVVPTLQAYGYLKDLIRAGDDEEINIEVPTFGKENENHSSTQYSYCSDNQSYYSYYSDENECKDGLEVNKYVEAVKKVPPSKMGFLIPYNDTSGEIQNYINFEDFSVYTCTFFMGNIRNLSACKTGIYVTLASYFLFQHVYIEINPKKQIQFVQIMNSAGLPLFAMRFQLHNSGITTVFQLFAALSIVSKQLDRQMGKIQNKIDSLQRNNKKEEQSSQISNSQRILPLGNLLTYLEGQYSKNKITNQITKSLDSKKGSQGSLLTILSDLFMRQEDAYKNLHPAIVYAFLGYDVQDNIEQMMHFHTFEYNTNE